MPCSRAVPWRCSGTFTNTITPWLETRSHHFSAQFPKRQCPCPFSYIKNIDPTRGRSSFWTADPSRLLSLSSLIYFTSLYLHFFKIKKNLCIKNNDVSYCVQYVISKGVAERETCPRLFVENWETPKPTLRKEWRDEKTVFLLIWALMWLFRFFRNFNPKFVVFLVFQSQNYNKGLHRLIPWPLSVMWVRLKHIFKPNGIMWPRCCSLL